MTIRRRRGESKLRPPAARAGNGKSSASASPGKSLKLPATAARDFETVVLVLQGGGALGAYQCGVYEGLHDAGIQPDWFAGISIGAINAAILAGNAPDRRVARLREFWTRISTPALPAPKFAFDWHRQWLDSLPKSGVLSSWASAVDAWTALLHGQSGFFVPRLPPPFAATAGTAAATSFYSAAPLRQTLEEFVDFDRINQGSLRFSVGAVNVRSGNFAYFDNRKTKIRVEHVLASAALPPAFASVEIDGDFYWDGGVVSNTPLEYVIGEVPRRDTLAMQVDLWSARGALPRTLGDVFERQKDIQYSSRTRAGTDDVAEHQRQRLALGKLIELLPGRRLPPALARAFEALTCTKVLDVVHLIYQAKSYEEEYKDYAFGPLTMAEHWSAGLNDMQRTLSHPEYFALPSRGVGVVTHDVHRLKK
ncbi:MAG: patatin-like phospholipase family protein [Rudaea sp.]|nr:patatin-like phospholipase family protein [Rudaea sp.]